MILAIVIIAICFYSFLAAGIWKFTIGKYPEKYPFNWRVLIGGRCYLRWVEGREDHA